MSVDSECAAGSLLYNEAEGKDVGECDGTGVWRYVKGYEEDGQVRRVE